MSYGFTIDNNGDKPIITGTIPKGFFDIAGHDHTEGTAGTFLRVNRRGEDGISIISTGADVTAPKAPKPVQW